MLHDSVVVVMHMRPQAMPLAMITMRKSTHGFTFLSCMSMGLCYDCFSKPQSIFCQMGITQVGTRTKILDAIREVHKKEWDVASLQTMERHSLRWY